MNTATGIFEEVGQRLETCRAIQSMVPSLGLLTEKQFLGCPTDVTYGLKTVKLLKFFTHQMPFRIVQTAAESGNVSELTFTLYEENAGPFSANGQTNSWTWRIPFHPHEQ